MKDHLSSDAPSDFVLRRRASERPANCFVAHDANFDLRLAPLSTHVYD
jgi:hypothetical protein